MKKVMKIILLFPLVYLVVLPLYLSSYSSATLCGAIDIIIKDSSRYHFVTKNQILNIVNGAPGKVLGHHVRDISPSEIEGRIRVLREIKDAEAYMTIDGTLHVYVDQRDPVMRVIPSNGGDYFIDSEGIVIRKRNLYTPRLHIVGGNVNITSPMLSGISILDTSIKNTILRDIYNLVDYINDDNFWSAQIDQIYVDNNDEIDLIPRVGNQVIHLGTADNFEGKLRNLEAFYDKVLPEVGWNKYSVINLEYKDQIVCKRR
jgi:cell division protein FtsQ